MSENKNWLSYGLKLFKGLYKQLCSQIPKNVLYWIKRQTCEYNLYFLRNDCGKHFLSPADYISLVMRLRNNHIREGATGQRDRRQEDKLHQFKPNLAKSCSQHSFFYDFSVFLIYFSLALSRWPRLLSLAWRFIILSLYIVGRETLSEIMLRHGSWYNNHRNIIITQ